MRELASPRATRARAFSFGLTTGLSRALALAGGAALAGCDGHAASALTTKADAATTIDAASSDAATDFDARPDGADAHDLGDAADGRDAAAELPSPPLPYARPSYVHLAETGLYSDFSTKAIAADAVAFAPTYKLWSDAADKRRWVRLPPGTQIDTSDMDHWVFPVGTKLWKEFSLGGVLLETRLVERYGTGPDDYWLGAFVWTADGSDATFAIDGAQNLNGTPHDAPAQKDCGDCHRGDVGRVMGLSAVQMSRADNPPALRELAAMGWLSAPPKDPLGFPVPGDATTAAALGYLHANCGHCHNENGTAWSDTTMLLRWTAADRDAATSAVVASIVDQPLQYWRGGTIKLRVDPGAPAMSALIARMSTRGSKDQMPPLATEIIDPAGIAAVGAWISGLPTTGDAGAPSDAAASDSPSGSASDSASQ
ncbi:MAG TPA: hypothetical protein VH560_04075 [Polyangia bacterium]|nr:hypothetical protein [Polyangia bacterium]